MAATPLSVFVPSTAPTLCPRAAHALLAIVLENRHATDVQPTCSRVNSRVDLHHETALDASRAPTEHCTLIDKP